MLAVNILTCCVSTVRARRRLDMSKIQVYYWPMLARGASLVRMLEHTGTPYDYISDSSRFGEAMSKWGAPTDCFAPPVVVDGDFVVSQSTASCLYLGNKLGLEPTGFNVFKAQQHMVDIVDTFEGNLGKSNEHGPTLKKFLEGERWPMLMKNLEAGIKGPFYCGDAPCAVDFFLAAHVDSRKATLFDPLNAKHGVDALAPFPKVLTVWRELSSADPWKKYQGPLQHMRPIKDEILDAYHS